MTDLDIVLFGATGYTGELVAEHLARTAPDGIRIGLAGRNLSKLESVRDRLGVDWPLLRADASDPGEVVKRARVICTTVGPYALLGRPLIEACAREGRDYLDLSGEPLFHRAVIDDLDEVAQASGARLVPSCGFDSVPSDILVLTVADLARAEGSGQLKDVEVVVTMKGGVSGGTAASLWAQAEAVGADPSLAAFIDDPYSLSPDRGAEATITGPADLARVSRRADGQWTGPFLMAAYNARIVRRSNALVGWAYGHEMRYQELTGFGTGLRGAVSAYGMASMIGLTNRGLRSRRARGVMRRMLPAPGTGPSDQVREKGMFRLELSALTTSGSHYEAVMAAPGDPYSATAVQMGQSALCLALDDLPRRAGVLTPATAMGTALARRLGEQGVSLSANRAR